MQLRFFHRAGPFTLSEIALHLGADDLSPDRGAISIHDIGDLESAESGQICVLPTHVISIACLAHAPELSSANEVLRTIRSIQPA